MNMKCDLNSYVFLSLFLDLLLCLFYLFIYLFNLSIYLPTYPLPVPIWGSLESGAGRQKAEDKKCTLWRMGSEQCWTPEARGPDEGAPPFTLQKWGTYFSGCTEAPLI